MPTWIVAILAFLAGGVFGFIITAVCVYDSVKNPERKWWEDT